MGGESSTARQRARQRRAVVNDEVILDAAVEAAADEGWAGLALRGVARRAGLSQRALINRFENRSELAAQVWLQRLAPVVEQSLGEVLDSAGLLGESPDAKRFHAAMRGFFRPGSSLAAALELLIVSQFDPAVAAAVRDTTGVAVATWCSPAGRALSKADAARRAYLLMFALGLIGVAGCKGAATLRLDGQFDEHLKALNAGVKPSQLPSAPGWHIPRTTEFDTGDPIKDEFYRAVLECVSEVGYQASTVDLIASRTDYSQGALFMRFGSKAELFVAATGEQNERSVRLNREFTDRLAEIDSAGIADAVTLRALLRPGLERLRALDSEQIRMSWHDEDILAVRDRLMSATAKDMASKHPDWGKQQVRAQVHADYAMGVGVLVLPLLLPGAWKLPYDVVTVPLAG